MSFSMYWIIHGICHAWSLQKTNYFTSQVWCRAFLCFVKCRSFHVMLDHGRKLSGFNVRVLCETQETSVKTISFYSQSNSTIGISHRNWYCYLTAFRRSFLYSSIFMLIRTTVEWSDLYICADPENDQFIHWTWQKIINDMQTDRSITLVIRAILLDNIN